MRILGKDEVTGSIPVGGSNFMEQSAQELGELFCQDMILTLRHNVAEDKRRREAEEELVDLSGVCC